MLPLSPSHPQKGQPRAGGNVMAVPFPPGALPSSPGGLTGVVLTEMKIILCAEANSPRILKVQKTRSLKEHSGCCVFQKKRRMLSN